MIIQQIVTEWLNRHQSPNAIPIDPRDQQHFENLLADIIKDFTRCIRDDVEADYLSAYRRQHETGTQYEQGREDAFELILNKLSKLLLE